MEQGIIEQFVNAIKQEPDDKKTTYSAIVSRIDEEGVIWVYVAGADKDTPTAQTGVEVKKGDNVTVEWRNNKLYIAGNYSNPAAGMARVVNVEMAAQAANQAAQNAVADAGRAREAAESVEGIARHAEEVAEGVEDLAKSAKTAADTAFTNLSQVQSVLEVAQWIATHGTYVKATLFNPNATYYTITATQVTEPSDDDKDSQGVLIYYELDNGIYVRTTDVAVDDQKTYYRVTGTPVAQPSAEHIADYYTLAVSEAMADYVQSHLALTNEGLYVMADDSEWKVLVRATGIDIIDGTGDTDVVVATFDNDGTTFYDGKGTANSNITAEFSTNGVKIGSESSTSRVSVSPEGFIIEDDNLLTVSEIGKGETLINHYENELVVGEKFGNNYVMLSPTNIGLIDPTGEIVLSVPYVKYNRDKTIADEGTLDFIFSSDTTETKKSGILSVTYNATTQDISMAVDGSLAPSNYGFAIKNDNKPSASILINKTAKRLARIDNISSLFHISGWLYVNFVCRIRGQDYQWTYAWQQYPPKDWNLSESFTLGGYNFRCFVKNWFDEYIEVKVVALTEEINIYMRPESYVAVRYRGLVLNGNPFLDYYGSAEAPYYSFGQRVGSTKGAYSLISGQGLEAQYPMEAVFGRYNDDNQDYVLSVGNGTDEQTLSNAFAVDWNGIVRARDKDNRFSDMFDLLRPVGSTYSTVDASFDPNDSWGGEWTKLPEGYILLSGSESGSYQVGTDTTTSGYKEYGANDKRIEDANIAHGHGFTQPTITSKYLETVKYTTGGSSPRPSTNGTTTTTGWAKASGGAVHDLGTPSQRANFNVMQKSVAVYTWIRTA